MASIAITRTIRPRFLTTTTPDPPAGPDWLATRSPPYPYPSGPRLRRSWAILEPVDFPKALQIGRFGTFSAGPAGNLLLVDAAPGGVSRLPGRPPPRSGRPTVRCPARAPMLPPRFLCGPQDGEKMNVPDAVPPAPKSLVLALVLWFFLGGLGIHRFYLRRRHAWTILILTVAGVVLTIAGVGLLLLGVVVVWLLVDLLFIAKWVGEHNARGSLHSPH